MECLQGLCMGLGAVGGHKRSAKNEVGTLVEEEGGVVWEVSRSQLLSRHTYWRRRLCSKYFTISGPSASGVTVEVRARCSVYVTRARVTTGDGAAAAAARAAGGRGPVEKALVLSFGVSFPKDVAVTCCRWVGPRSRSLRVNNFLSQVDDNFVGDGCRLWRADDHAEGDTLRLGVSLLLVAVKGSLATVPDSLAFGRLCGKGGLGEVFEVADTKAGRQDLIGKVSSRPIDIALEAQVLRRLAGLAGFPELVGVFSAPTEDVMVMQRLQRDLRDLQRDPVVGGSERRFCAETVVVIGRQLVRCLQHMHKCGLVHNDIKPANMMTDGSFPSSIYLIDFGLASHYSVAGHHIGRSFSADEGCYGIDGTPAFCSADAHLGATSRRSDLEAAVFVLMSFAVKDVPWSCSVPFEGGRQQFYDAILSKKLNIAGISRHLEKQLKDDLELAKALVRMLRYCRSLEFDAEPDCELLIGELSMALPAPRSDPLVCVPTSLGLACVNPIGGRRADVCMYTVADKDAERRSSADKIHSSTACPSAQQHCEAGLDGALTPTPTSSPLSRLVDWQHPCDAAAQPTSSCPCNIR